MFDKCQQGPFDSDAYMTYASCPRLADHVRVCANLSWVYRAECWVRRLHSTMLATPSTYCFCLSLCFALGRGVQAVPTPRSFELPHPVILSLFLSPGLWCRGLTPYTSLSLSTRRGVGSSVQTASPVRTRTPAFLGRWFLPPGRFALRGSAVRGTG